jgi:hypothetical protein
MALAGALAAAVAVVVWWLFFSRAPWSERVSAILLAIVALLATRRVVHPSISGGMMGMMLPVYAVPVLCLALVAGAVAGHRLSNGLRRATMAGAILLACGVFALIRTGGIIGFRSDLHWRWTPTPEDRLLAQTAHEKDPVPTSPSPSAAPLDSARGTPDARAIETKPTDKPIAPPPARVDSAPGAPLDAARGGPVAAKDPEKKAEWPGLVILCRQRQPHLYPGAARRRRDRFVLRLHYRRAGLETQRPGAVLGVECRARSARDADPQQRSRLYTGCDRHPEYTGRPRRLRPLVA